MRGVIGMAVGFCLFLASCHLDPSINDAKIDICAEGTISLLNLPTASFAQSERVLFYWQRAEVGRDSPRLLLLLNGEEWQRDVAKMGKFWRHYEARWHHFIWASRRDEDRYRTRGQQIRPYQPFEHHQHRLEQARRDRQFWSSYGSIGQHYHRQQNRLAQQLQPLEEGRCYQLPANTPLLFLLEEGGERREVLYVNLERDSLYMMNLEKQTQKIPHLKRSLRRSHWVMKIHQLMPNREISGVVSSDEVGEEEWHLGIDPTFATFLFAPQRKD